MKIRPQAISGAALALLMIGGCASTSAPVDQIRYFSQAFNAVNTVGQPLLDDLALAERAQGKAVAVRRAQGLSAQGASACPPAKVPWQLALDGRSGIINGFCLPDASYFAELGDPPATAQLRGGLHVVERYAEVLSILAEGRNLEQALGQVEALGQDVGGLLALAGGAPLAIAPALSALRPLLEHVARQANAEEARRLILEGTPRVTALIAALRESAPAVFGTLVEAPAARLPQPAAAQGSLSADIVAQVEARRLAVSQYVVLLERLQVAWDSTVVAARSPDQGRLATLVARTAELRTDAEAVRRGLAALRAGAAPAR